MLKIIKTLFGKKNEEQDQINIPLETLEEIDSMRNGVDGMVTRGDILRYPPAEIGFPALIPGNYILREKQTDMIQAIKRELNIRDSEFEQLMMPMLDSFANFVQLFPASEHHHHRAQSGLMRHSLEVCFQCIRKAKNIEFDSMEMPVVKSSRMLAWRLAIATAGLLHDIGKPFTDYEVWDKSGTYHWPPGRTPIHEWAKANKIERYFLVWKSSRHQQHHSSTTAMMMMIMPQILHEFLLSEGNDIYNELTRAMAVSTVRLDATDETASEMKNKILKIVKESDVISVRHDLQRYGGDAVRATQSGVPAVQRIVDAMRYLLKKGVWQPNKPGNPIWVTTHGVFIVWGTAVKDITNTVKKSGAVIPQSANSLADLMMSYKLCIPNVNKNEDTAYWRIAPHIMNDRDSRNSKEPKVALSCLRLISPDVLFVDTMEPLPVSARIRIESEWREFQTNKGKNIPVLKESRPYVGTKEPRENSIPADVDPDILKGGTLLPDENDSPLENMFGASNPVTPDNAHQLLHHLKLLSDADYEKVTARQDAKAKAQAEQDNQKPGEAFQSPSAPIVQSQPVKAPARESKKAKVEPQQLSLKEVLSKQGSAEDAPPPVTDIEQYQEPEFDRETLSLWETLKYHSVTDGYQNDERNLVESKPAVDPMTDARAEIQRVQDEVDSGNLTPAVTENDFGYDKNNAAAFETEQLTALHQDQSPLFRNAPDLAKDKLASYVAANSSGLFHESGHCCIILETGVKDSLFEPMRDADWIWYPFMEAPCEYYTHRSQMCFYLRKELNSDIDQLSGNRYRASLSPFDLSEVSVDMTEVYRAIATKGACKTAFNGDPVIALSSLQKRRIAQDLNINANQFQQVLIDNFDYVTRTGVDYILVNSNIQNFMVNDNE